MEDEGPEDLADVANVVSRRGDRMGRDVTLSPSRDHEAMRRALDPADVLPMLHRLVRTAPADSDDSVFAHRQLAELIAPRHPWRAALYARRVVTLRPEDDRGWAILAFAQTLLHNYRVAASAYARALACAPQNPWYQHNLGHLLDVALGRPREALPWLEAAFAAAPDHVEIATSYAHALARGGELTLAKRVLGRAMRQGAGPTQEQSALWRWFQRGAPEPKHGGIDGVTVAPAVLPSRPPVPGRSADAAPGMGRALTNAVDPDVPRRRARGAGCGSVEETLVRHLAHLPFDAAQRARARAICREVVATAADRARPEALAAAVAYAVIAHDEVPLTQTEVAATFRVRVSALRARYQQLREAFVRTQTAAATIDSRVPLRASRSARSPRKAKK